MGISIRFHENAAIQDIRNLVVQLRDGQVRTNDLLTQIEKGAQQLMATLKDLQAEIATLQQSAAGTSEWTGTICCQLISIGQDLQRATMKLGLMYPEIEALLVEVDFYRNTCAALGIKIQRAREGEAQ